MTRPALDLFFEETTVPKVGNKHFPYTPAGRKAAAQERSKRQERRRYDTATQTHVRVKSGKR